MTSHNIARHAVRGLLAATAFAALCPAYAQASDASEGTGLSDIIVTAQRREERLQSVPISVSAISGSALSERGMVNLGDVINTAPNVEFNKFQGDGGFTIRGVTSGGVFGGTETGTTIYQDEVFVLYPSTALLDFLDLDRIEVLRGPQGTLYGKNSVGGTVNLFSVAPTDSFGGFAEGSIEKYDTYRARAGINAPLSDNLSARIAGAYSRTDGFYDNIFTGKPAGGKKVGEVKGALRYRSDRTDITLRGDYVSRRGDGEPLSVVTPPSGVGFITNPGAVLAGDGAFKVAVDTDEFRREDHYTTSLNANVELSDSISFKSISAYSRSKIRYRSDLDGYNVPLQDVLFTQRSQLYSQEFQLYSDKSRPVSFQTGVFLMHVNLKSGVLLHRGTVPDPRVAAIGRTITSDQRLKTDTLGLFANVDVKPAEALTLTAGLRWSQDRKNNREVSRFIQTSAGLDTGVVTSAGKKSFDAFTPSVKLAYQPTERLLAYATVSRGYKSGGFNQNIVQFAPGLSTYEPEYAWNYEAGLKADWLDRTLRTNIAVFQMNYTNQQVSFVDQNLNSVTLNAGKSRIRGIEAEIVMVPAKWFKVDVNAAYLDAEYTRYTRVASDGVTNIDFAGTQMPNAPKFSVSTGAEISAPLASGRVRLRGEIQFRDKSLQVPQTGDAPVPPLPAHTLVNGFISYEADDRWSLSLFARNLTNERFFYASSRNSLLQDVRNVGEPRTFGLRAGYRF